MPREISHVSLIWLDRTSADSVNKDYQKLLNKKFSDEIGMSICESVDKAIQLINSSISSVMVVSGADGAIIVPMIKGYLKQIKNVCSVVVFCTNTEAHSKWASLYPDLIKLVSNDIKEVVEKVEELVSQAN